MIATVIAAAYVAESCRIPAKETRKHAATNMQFREVVRKEKKPVRFGSGHFTVESDLLTYTLPS